MEVKPIHSISEISRIDWNGIAGLTYPFMRHEFLAAMEASAAICPQTGWLPRHLLLRDRGVLRAIMPFYVKEHSWGEYVFDQQWGQAYQRYGLNYYPKALSAAPLTPCHGPRIMMAAEVNPQDVAEYFLAFIKEFAAENGVSSWHCLFPDRQTAELLRSLGLSIREGVQFHWYNQAYRDFDDFLQTFSASKRKMLKRERRKVQQQGITLQRILGKDVTEQQWQIFFEFYKMTYLKKGMPPYLNLEFFQQIAASMPEQLLLIMASKDNIAVGAALSFVGEDCLYGRYWGGDEQYDALHFEACYYQGVDYCIEHGINRFDAGAQGEHKISRGFQPITTYSAHWIKDAEFAKAIAQFVTKEQHFIQTYKQDAAAYLPFKQTTNGALSIE